MIAERRHQTATFRCFCSTNFTTEKLNRIERLPIDTGGLDSSARLLHIIVMAAQSGSSSSYYTNEMKGKVTSNE